MVERGLPNGRSGRACFLSSSFQGQKRASRRSSTRDFLGLFRKRLSLCCSRAMSSEYFFSTLTSLCVFPSHRIQVCLRHINAGIGAGRIILDAAMELCILFGWSAGCLVNQTYILGPRQAHWSNEGTCILLDFEHRSFLSSSLLDLTRLLSVCCFLFWQNAFALLYGGQATHDLSAGSHCINHSRSRGR